MKPGWLVVGLVLAILRGSVATAQTVRGDADAVVRYVLSCQKPNGAFGPLEQAYTDVAWTYPAVYTLKLLNTPVPKADSCFRNGQQAWIEKAPWKNGPWYGSFFQKTDLYRLFGKEGPVEEGIAPGKVWQLAFKPRTSYLELRNYATGAFFDLASLWCIVGSTKQLRATVANPDVANTFIASRQTSGGGFGEGLGTATQPTEAQAHLISTHDAVMTLTALGLPVPDKQACINWIRSCQTPAGGFRWHPTATAYSNQPDVWYTWAALQTLNALGAKPANQAACVQWLNTLQNPDGGFGDRPGWASRLFSTYYAVESLYWLTGDARRAIITRQLARTAEEVIPEGRYHIYQAHHKSPAGGPGMVDSVAAMGLNLIGIKSTEKAILPGEGMSQGVKEARAYAARKGYKLEIVECPENYSHKLNWFSGLSADHVSNFIIPPGLSNAALSTYNTAYQAGKLGLPWISFKEQVIQPILNLKTLFYPELDYTMANAYMVYDEGLDGHTGYNAIPGAHFGNSDWMRHFPYKERWIGRLPVVADGDAHGDIQQWRKWLNEFRNVYIAPDYHYEAYLDASSHGRSVCVIRYSTGEIRYYGAPSAVDYLKKHRKEWQWWSEKRPQHVKRDE